MRYAFLVSAALLCAQPVHAGMTKIQYTAPNGVVVTVNADEFAGRREYGSPEVNLIADDGHGMAMVSEVFNNGKLLGLTLQGVIFYSDDWRFYSSAIFRGGEPAKYHRLDGDVSGCGRYGCSMSESFLIDINRDEARQRAEGGEVAVQIRSDHGQTALVRIPLAYFEAVADVAGEPAQTAAAVAVPTNPTASSPAASPPPVADPESSTTPTKAKKPTEAKPKKPAIVCITCQPR